MIIMMKRELIDVEYYSDDDDHDHENYDLPGPATSVRTVSVAEEFPSCLLVNAFAQIVYFL